MKINELLVESQIDEISLGGIASGIGRGLGTVRNAFSAGADGYADKRQEYLDQRAAQLAARAGKTPAPAAQDPAATAQTTTQTPANNTQATSQTAPAPADDSAYKQALAAVDKLDPAGKKQLAGDLQKSMASGGAEEPAANTTPAADETPAAVDPGQDHGLGKQSDGKFIKPGQKFDTETGKALAPASTTPEPTAPAPTAPAPTAPAPTTGGKMTPAQQAALKAKLQGQRQAGKTTATQTGSGFKDYVGGSQTKLTGADAQGNPVFKKLQRESVAFSKFLGVHI